MALINLKFASEVLGMQTEINVVVPQRSTKGQIGMSGEAKGEKYKTLLLLHGLSDDASTWLRRSSIERYATENGIAVIMPAAERSFYTDMKYGENFYTYISEEVPRIAREFLPLSDKREDNFIAGLSMGGYGALKIALKNPERYAAVAGLSSVADVQDFIEVHAPKVGKLVFGEDMKVPPEEDLFAIAEACNSSEVKPRVMMIEGLSDFLLDGNLRLKAKFESLDYDYTYIDAPGGHSWAFWDKHIQYVLKWMLGKI